MLVNTSKKKSGVTFLISTKIFCKKRKKKNQVKYCHYVILKYSHHKEYVTVLNNSLKIC